MSETVESVAASTEAAPIAEAAAPVVEVAAPESVVIESVKSQIAEIFSTASRPGVWAVQGKYTNNDGVVSSFEFMFGPDADGSYVYPLWKSKNDFVVVHVEDYDGELLIPCPDVVSV